MKLSNFICRSLSLLLCVIFLCAATSRPAAAQAQTPLTSEELLQLVRQLPKNPGVKDEIITELRRRGIGFPLTGGMRSVVATKSRNDAELRRALEEAERRRANPAEAVAMPTEAEAAEVLEKARAESALAVEQMPDFVVKQLVTRKIALGATRNWTTTDRLVVAVSFRVSGGEQYRVLAVNGIQGAPNERESNTYMQVGGSTSTGEFVSVLAELFREGTKAKFKTVAAETLGARRTIVYEFTVEKPNSHQTISASGAETITTGYHGRVWVDAESARVLRIESNSNTSDIPADYPVRAARRQIDYGWVTIAERPYLLPSQSLVEMTVRQAGQPYQSRNEIRFRNYQKYGTEIKVIEEDVFEEEPAGKKP